MRIWPDDLPGPLDGEKALQYYKEKTAQECEPYRSAAAWAPEGSRCHIDQLKYWVPVPWGDGACGRITLAGDAAHAILPCKCYVSLL
jgi:2-polyprenyl-6-methoxyphenol hydroxylase-like FAD-dependent oxidoreductase